RHSRQQYCHSKLHLITLRCDKICINRPLAHCTVSIPTACLPTLRLQSESSPLNRTPLSSKIQSQPDTGSCAKRSMTDWKSRIKCRLSCRPGRITTIPEYCSGG